jgi:hypothetical protein
MLGEDKSIGIRERVIPDNGSLLYEHPESLIAPIPFVERYQGICFSFGAI